jgi:hypothetical protein
MKKIILLTAITCCATISFAQTSDAARPTTNKQKVLTTNSVKPIAIDQATNKKVAPVQDVHQLSTVDGKTTDRPIDPKAATTMPVADEHGNVLNYVKPNTQVKRTTAPKSKVATKTAPVHKAVQPVQ